MTSELTFFQSLSWLFQLTYFVKCKRTLLELNFYKPYRSSERERKFCHCLFTSFTKREIRHFHVVVVQWRQTNIQKSVMHVQSCFFALSSYCFFTFSSPPHLKLDIIYDMLWSVRNRIFSVQIELFLPRPIMALAPADSIRNGLRLIGISFVSG